MVEHFNNGNPAGDKDDLIGVDDKSSLHQIINVRKATLDQGVRYVPSSR